MTKIKIIIYLNLNNNVYYINDFRDSEAVNLDLVVLYKSIYNLLL